jgi:type I restriction enzyme S subunit
MAGSWHCVPLGELCDEERGITYGIVKVGEFVPGGVPVVRGGDIRDGRITCDDSKRVTEDVSNQFRRTILRGGEIVLNLIADPGHSAMVPRELAGHNVSRDVAVIPLNDETDVRFVDFFLKSKIAIDWLAARLQGSVTQKINLSTLRELPVPQPPLAEQKAIAAILGALDDKIELNRRMNATLDAMARALFQSWFVDFDPVRAKLDGREPVGVDPAMAALFPGSFQDSEAGHIPKGWEVRSLDKIANFLNGLALQKFPPGDGPTLPVIKIAQLRKGDSEGADRCSADVPQGYIIQDGDLLFSWSGSLEVELWCGGSGALNQHLFKVTSNAFPKWFYFFWTAYHLREFRLIAADKATTMGHIQRRHLSAAKVLVPPPSLLDGMTRAISPLIDKLIANNIESRILATLRDALLPMLLSGALAIH